MRSDFHNMIEYEGINVNLISQYDSFKQFITEKTVSIPTNKPDVKQIVKVKVEADIIWENVIKTPIGVAMDGQKLTGNKVLAGGELTIRYQYIGFDEQQSIHNAMVKIPFWEHIALPQNFTESKQCFTQIAIEDVFCRPMDYRNISNTFTLMLIAGVN